MSTRRQILAFPSSLGLLALSGCSFLPDYDHAGDDAPRFEPGLNRPAKLAWVFSSGGPRGFVHVGVLKALEELGHTPDLIVGGSVGALIGVLYAAGIKAAQIEAMALELGVTEMGRLAVTGDGKFTGTPLAELVNSRLQSAVGTQRIDKLPIRFAAVAVDRQSRQAVWLNAGDCGIAVQASCAIEGMFTPVRIRGLQYVDADLVAPMPVRMARASGALKVLSVDASAHEDKAPESAQRYKAGDLRKRQLTAPDAQAADVNLHPNFGYYINVSLEFRQRCIRVGYETTMAQAASLRALHA